MSGSTHFVWYATVNWKSLESCTVTVFYVMTLSFSTEFPSSFFWFVTDLKQYWNFELEVGKILLCFVEIHHRYDHFSGEPIFSMIDAGAYICEYRAPPLTPF